VRKNSGKVGSLESGANSVEVYKKQRGKRKERKKRELVATCGSQTLLYPSPTVPGGNDTE